MSLKKIKYGLTDAGGSYDNERAILPTIIFCTQEYKGFIGYLFAFGWWRWAFTITFIFQYVQLTQ